MKNPFSIRTIILAGSLLLQLGTLCLQSRGAAGDVDLSFDAGSDVNGTVTAIAVQSDGKVIIGGDFTAVKGLACPGIARLNADGSGDATFSPAASFSNIRVADLTMQPDGKFLVCGKSRDSFAIAFAARLNTNGSLDNTFVAAPEPTPSQPESNGSGYTSVIVQPDGKILLGGYFSPYSDDSGGVYPEVALVQRLNPNGTSDTNFTVSIGSFFTQVTSLALQSNGQIMACGLDPLLMRLNANGGVDNTFNGENIGAYSVAVQGDGKLLIGGVFGAVHGTNRNGIARLHANGNLDTTFDPGTGASPLFNGSGVVSINIQSDGKVFIGGDFTLFNGTNRNHVARLNTNGSLDSSFNPGAGANGIVRSIALQPDGNVLIGGDFTTVNGALHPHVARLYGDSVASSLNIVRLNTFVIVSWPVTGLNFQLQENTNLSLPNSWLPVAQPAVTNAGQISVIVPTTVGRKFFRLRSQ